MEKEMICNQCGGVIEMEGALRDRVIAKDAAGNDVTERYFDCPICGKHYTVTVIDRDMRLLIQKRKQIQYRVNKLLKENGSRKKMQQLLDTDAELKDDLKHMAQKLKEEYEEEIRWATEG